MSDAPLRIFHISPEWCGDACLAQMFRDNGYRALAHLGGALASDIAMAGIRGQAPLGAYPRARFFTGLWRTHLPARPPLEAWRAFAELDRRIPGARFVLTTRDPDAWLLDRLTRNKGATLRCYMNHLGLGEEAAIETWLRGWHDHIAAVEAHFGADGRLIRLDLGRDTPAEACARLAEWLPMPQPPAPGTKWIAPADDTLDTGLAALFDGFGAQPPASDDAYARDLAAFCLKGLDPAPGGEAAPWRAGSSHAAEWRGGAQAFDREGAPLPYAIGPAPGTGADGPWIAVADHALSFKQVRAEGVINDILRLGRRDAVRIDMEDARWIGAAPGRELDWPVLGHNRREGARNLVLWPLPDLHVPGLPGYATADCPDQIPFDQKEDRLVWRGHISGAVRQEGDRPGPSSHRLLLDLREAAAAGDPAAEARAFDSLCQTQRLAFLRRWIDHPDFDIGMVLAWSLRDLTGHPLLAPYARPRRPASYFHRFRYQLNISGYDHGSNFLGAANSQSVVLKEEDGWEVFYSGRFQPWKHYIPLQRDAPDIAEKLAWARANPLRCQEISAAARAEVQRLANPGLLRAMMGHILDGLAAAR